MQCGLEVQRSLLERYRWRGYPCSSRSRIYLPTHALVFGAVHARTFTVAVADDKEGSREISEGNGRRHFLITPCATESLFLTLLPFASGVASCSFTYLLHREEADRGTHENEHLAFRCKGEREEKKS